MYYPNDEYICSFSLSLSQSLASTTSRNWMSNIETRTTSNSFEYE